MDGGVDASMPTDSGPRPALCARAADCDDGLYCNGEETCEPGGAGADSRGCVAGVPPCAAAVCDEEADDCSCDTPDQDGDGEAAMGCGGADCDDDDPARYPGNAEVCDAVDQDCDPATLAGATDGDVDGDGFVSAMCCDGDRCGDDCADDDPAVRPDARELCNAIDDDCSGRSDDPGPEDLLCPGGVCAAGRCLFTTWDRLFVPDRDALVFVSDVDHDDAGNLFLAGSFSTGVDFGDADPVDHTWLASLGPDGRLRWTLEASDKVWTNFVAVDTGTDRVYVSGNGRDDATVVAGVAVGRDDFLATATTNGEVISVRRIPSSNGRLFADSTGVTVTGVLSAPFDFGGGTEELSGVRDVFIAAYDPEGSFRSVTTFGGTGVTLNLDAAERLNSGEFLLVLDVGSAVSWGGEPLVGDSNLITAVRMTGEVLWSHEIGRTGPVGLGVSGTAVDDDRVYLTGPLYEPQDLGGVTVGPTDSQPTQCFVVGMSHDGDFVWRRVLSGFPTPLDGLCRTTSLALREDGTLALAGNFSGTLGVGSGGLRAFGDGLDVFLAAITRDNVHIRDRLIGGEGGQQITPVVSGPGGSLTLAGFTAGVVDFGSGPRSTGDRIAGFIARIAD